MKKVNTREIQEGITSKDFIKAKKCEFLLYDENGGPALWHRCFCDYATKDRNMPQPCNLVWRGNCVKTSTPSEDQHGRDVRSDNRKYNPLLSSIPPNQHGRKPNKVKPLAQYLAEYVEQEVEVAPAGRVTFLIESWRELLEQALDAYESTENVKIRIERVP